MKVIFLDFDGVLNSEGSFLYEQRLRNGEWNNHELGRVNETLCHVCTSNFQAILDRFPETKIVISSTWRISHDINWLKIKLASYGIDSSNVIDVTPQLGNPRAEEITEWLSGHPEVVHYLIIDDYDDDLSKVHGERRYVRTSWNTGLTWDHVEEAFLKLKTPPKSERANHKEE